jgi:DNA-directed RNA polymerase sigma subunit (sigma70/sigma32)
MARATLSKRSRLLKDYLLLMQEHEQLGEEDACAYLEQARWGSVAAHRALIEACLPLVVGCAAARRGGALNFGSLLEAGNLALILALAEAETSPLQENLLAHLTARIEAALQSRFSA